MHVAEEVSQIQIAMTDIMALRDVSYHFGPINLSEKSLSLAMYDRDSLMLHGWRILNVTQCIRSL
jgi:hypothetical protein